MICSFFSDTGGRGAAYALLEYAFRSIYGEALPKIEKDSAGKPFFPERNGIHFSLSHGKHHVLVTVGDTPCGCDAEHERPVRSETAARVSSEDELRYFSFLELWTLKESYIKFSSGLKGNMRDIRFSLENGAVKSPEEGVFARVFHVGDAYLSVVCRGEEPSAPIFVPADHLNS